MDRQRPIRNLETGMWEVWDFAYEEDGVRYYDLHTFWDFKDAIKFWNITNKKKSKKSVDEDL